MGLGLGVSFLSQKGWGGERGENQENLGGSCEKRLDFWVGGNL